MRMYIAHLKSGKCPKGSKDVTKKGIHRCKLSGRHGMYGKKRR